MSNILQAFLGPDESRSLSGEALRLLRSETLLLILQAKRAKSPVKEAPIFDQAVQRTFEPLMAHIQRAYKDDLLFQKIQQESLQQFREGVMQVLMECRTGLSPVFSQNAGARESDIKKLLAANGKLTVPRKFHPAPHGPGFVFC